MFLEIDDMIVSPFPTSSATHILVSYHLERPGCMATHQERTILRKG